MNRTTHAYKNITFPQLHWQSVKIDALIVIHSGFFSCWVQIKFFFAIETEFLLVVLWWHLWIMYDNFGIKENIWCDILGFDQSEQINIKLILHSVWKFWQIVINSIAKKSLIWLVVVKLRTFCLTQIIRVNISLCWRKSLLKRTALSKQLCWLSQVITTARTNMFENMFTRHPASIQIQVSSWPFSAVTNFLF